MSNDTVISYYQSSQWLYSLFIYNSRSLGMHFGFWNKHTQNRQEAILNENQSIIDHGNITKKMRILDAGCGVGGTALYVAEKTGATVCGITLDPEQVKLASQYAKKRNLDHRVSFTTQDYTNTNFPDKSFDVIYGIESICYAYPKTNFLNEAYRLLKKGGRLILADGYLTREPKTPKEIQTIREFNEGFAMTHFDTESQMISDIQKSGFKEIQHLDVTKNTLKTIDFFRQLVFWTSIPCTIAQYIPIRYAKGMYMNHLAMRATASAYDQHLFTYQIHTAVKPKR